ncbi:MAG TPA: glycosyltransferase family 2 protein [Pirellulales bacterium]|nr:glycosyltransferase family 2 protein [Pirellulales bacterium]
MPPFSTPAVAHATQTTVSSILRRARLTFEDTIRNTRLAEHPPSHVLVVMPAYNAARTLEQTVADIPTNALTEIVVVDDCSRDETVQVAERLGLHVLRHANNRGYGGNQKTCYEYALSTAADVIVMLHPDYQYDSRVVPLAVKLIELGICDVVLGSRIRTRAEALAGGMPLIKYIANRVLTTIQNISLGQNLADFHSGFRAYRREVLERVNSDVCSDDFVFDGQFLVQCVNLGFRLGDLPVPVRYFDEASSINFRRSAIYALGCLYWIARWHLHRLRVWRSPLFTELEENKEQASSGESRPGRPRQPR